MKGIKLSQYLHHLFAIVAFVIIAALYFMPQFQGKKLVQGDTVSWKGMVKEIETFEQKTGEEILWTNSMFGGMPAYQIGGSQNKNMIQYLRKGMSLFMGRPAGLFILGMISFYILMLTLKVNPWLSIIGAISFAFMTNNLVLLEAGHMTKVTTLMTSPLIVAGVLMAYDKKLLFGSFIFTLGMAMNLLSNHVQMTYYLGLMLIIFVVIQLVRSIREKRVSAFAKASGYLLIGLLLAVGSTASKLWTTYEYSKDTMRGKPILETKTSEVSSSTVDGLDWDYAMSWSNGVSDLIPSFIPLAVGGSSAEPLDKKSEFAKELRKRGVRQGGMKAPMYWGSLPFTSGPIYFGALMFFLFLFGAIYIKGPIKWWIVGAVILTFLLSLGKNFEFFNRLFFDYFPMYSKFRTPNSILTMTGLVIPLLGILGLDRALKSEADARMKKSALIAAGVLGGLALILGVAGGTFFDFSSAGDTRYEQAGFNINTIMNDRASMLSSSAFRSLAFILIGLAGMFAYVKEWLKPIFIIAILGLAILIDQFSVNMRYMSAESFVSKRNYEKTFTPRSVDNQILKDADPNFRVLDLSINTFNSSRTSYFHKTIGGYHAAKLQRYQDIIDRHISRNNQNVLNMLNTKYIISGQGGQETVQQNPAALGNAWFVNNINVVNTPDQEIDGLTNFDPAGDAVINKEFSNYVSGLNPQKSGSIRLDSYRPDLLKYSSNSDTEQLAVFSEVWYGPNKGWKAYIDGKETSHIRANYLLRALRIPAGQHQIEFVFKPSSYHTGELISLICSLLIIVLGGWFSFKEFRG